MVFFFFPSQEEEAEILKKLNLRNHRASCVADEINYRKLNNLKTIGDSVLGQVRACVRVTSRQACSALRCVYRLFLFRLPISGRLVTLRS